ncbi:triose-phosphate isomerase [Rhizobium sp. NXC24]|uniref:triose-phosphate isomerase n=1 Tax=Rhizobium sp. NXC24 TaxID=2048897 RepID=UPI000CDF53FA|nr:triose-phosphate isomerase [Rhizobium sp. NXC24]AVA24383.1 triosephosphate isomerase 2 [Rhizobium sp. NXC24]
MTGPYLIAGNWKMNGLNSSLAVLEETARSCERMDGDVEVVMFLPATLLAVSSIVIKDTKLQLGGQDCSSERSGAFTGEISAEMLKDAGARFVMIGHSERRLRHAEGDDLVRQKAIQAIEVGLTALICIGESGQEKAEGKTLAVLSSQLTYSVPRVSSIDQIVIAYEPTWVTGTCVTPTLDEIAHVHRHIRSELLAHWGDSGQQIRILYGGSVQPSNAAEILAIAEVGGLLVGGASLDAKQFSAICEHGRSVRAAA